MNKFFERILEWLITPFGWLWRWHERAVLCDTGDKISMIIVTVLAQPGSIFKCDYRGKWYGLIHPDDWAKLKEALPEQPIENLPASPLSLNDVPVVFDEELAQQVFIGALADGSNQ